MAIGSGLQPLAAKEANALWSYVVLWQPAAISWEGLPPHEGRTEILAAAVLFECLLV